MKYSYQIRGETLAIEIEKAPNGFRASVNGERHAVEILRTADGELNLLIDSQPQTIYFAMEGANRFVALNGETFALNVASGRTARRDRALGHGDEDAIRAPMPGQVRAVSVTQGESVAKGQTLLVIEAMKMEIRIPAPQAGRAKILVGVGESVEREQVLAEIE